VGAIEDDVSERGNPASMVLRRVVVSARYDVKPPMSFWPMAQPC
jgi:hypothetical protein